MSAVFSQEPFLTEGHHEMDRWHGWIQWWWHQ